MATARKRTRKKPATKPDNPPPRLDPDEARLDDLLVESQALRRRFMNVVVRDGLFERGLRVLESIRFRQLTGMPLPRAARRVSDVFDSYLLVGRYDERIYALDQPFWLPVARGGKGGSRSPALRQLTADVTHAFEWVDRTTPQRAQQHARRLAAQLCERACALGLRLEDEEYEDSPVRNGEAFAALVERLALGHHRGMRSIVLDVLEAVGHDRRAAKDWR